MDASSSVSYDSPQQYLVSLPLEALELSDSETLEIVDQHPDLVGLEHLDCDFVGDDEVWVNSAVRMKVSTRRISLYSLLISAGLTSIASSHFFLSPQNVVTWSTTAWTIFAAPDRAFGSEASSWLTVAEIYT